MNIYLHELRSYRRNTIIWVVALCAATLFLFSMYPAFSRNVGDLTKVFSAYPAAVQDAFNLPLRLVDKISFLLIFYSFILTVIMLCGAVQAMNLGVSIIAKETAGKTVDFLLTKPVTRASVVAQKLLAMLTCLAVTSALYLAVSTAMASAVTEKAIDYRPFLLISLSFFFVQVIFGALGLAVAVVFPKIKAMLPVSLSTVFAFFIIGAVGEALKQDAIFYLSPFKYFNASYIMLNSAYQTSYAVTGAAVVVVAVALGFLVYSKRDIHAV